MRRESHERQLPFPVRALLSLLLRSFPPRFRRSFGAGILDAVYTEYARRRAIGRLSAAVFLMGTAWDLLTAGFDERLHPTWRRPQPSTNRREEVTTMLEQLTKDFAYGARSLARAPGFTAVILLTLSLAIGANVTIFTVVNAVVLAPLSFPGADRLVAIRASAPGSDFSTEFNVSAEFYPQYREEAGLLEDLGIYNMFGSTLRTEEFSERVRMSVASHSFFTTLGARTALGRLPNPEDGEDVAVISYALWTGRFGADSTIVGQAYEMAGARRTVIGVTSAEFRFPEERTALWIPLVLDLEDLQPGQFFWSLVGRLKPGVGPDDLAAQLTPLAARLPERYGGSVRYQRLMEHHRAVVRPLKDHILGDVAGLLWVLLGTVAVVLTIACANVANLFLVRSENRRRDLAVRQALGASRHRLIQAQMVEALLLAGAGAAAGGLLTWIGVPLLLRAAPPRVPRLDLVQVDGASLAFACIIAVAAALTFGLVPAIRSSGRALSQTLRSAGRGDVGRARHLSREILVVFQTALALVLLVGSGLLIRSLVQLRNVDPGYDTRDIFTFQVAPSEPNPDGPFYARFHYALMDRLAALPAVQSVGVVRELPLDEGTPRRTFVTERSTAENQPFVRYTFTGGDYFQAMEIELLRGRYFTRADHDTDLGHAIVSQSAADLLWPNEDPIGKRVRFPSDSSGWETIVGVVEDIRQNDFRETDGALIYFPLVGRSPRSWAIESPGYVVKSSRAATMADEVREIVREMDPGAPFYAVHTLERLAGESMARLSFTTLTLGIASALALILGAVGLYGVLSYVVAQRTQEIGLRMALGASAPNVRWMVVQQGCRVAFVGVAIGLIAAIGATRVLDTLLFGIEAVDLSTFAGTSIVMVLVGLVASYVPARRASAVDPILSLRAD